MEKLIKHNGTVYRHVDAGIISGYVKEKIADPPDGFPFVEWNGPKMPHSLWQTILAFFVWTYDDSKKGSSSADEALVHLFYNEAEQQWLVWAPPQRGMGMTVKTVDDHPNWKQAEEFAGYQKIGTGHHHCSSAAFQSGTDSTDESCCNGLHFTIGNLDKKYFTIHARAVFNGNMVEVNIWDWVDLSDKYKELAVEFPELMVSLSYYSHNACPPDSIQFPAPWKENIIKWGSGSSVGFHNGHCSQQGSFNSQGYFRNSANGTREWVSTKKEEEKKVTTLSLSPADRGEMELERLMVVGNLTLVELQLVSDHINDPANHGKLDMANKSVAQVMDVLKKNGLNPRWLEKYVEECVETHNNGYWSGC